MRAIVSALTLGLVFSCAPKPEPPQPAAIYVPPPQPAKSEAPVASVEAPHLDPVARATSDAPSPLSSSIVPDQDGEPARKHPFVSRCTGVVFAIGLKSITHRGVDITSELKNTGNAPVSLMLTDDGSTENMRNPTVRFVLQPDMRTQYARCGNINSLEPTDFVTLAPGRSTPLDWVMAPRPSTPGHYSLTAVYRNDPDVNPLRGLAAPPTPELLARVKRTVACEVTSNTLEFDWHPAPAPAGCQPGDPLCVP
jgi:hypothetical protein